MDRVYEKSETIALRGSASMLHNNLTVFNYDREKSTQYGVVGRHVLHLIKVDETGLKPNFRQIAPQMGREAELSQFFPIMAAKFFKFFDRVLIVILTSKAIFFYDDESLNLIYAHNLVFKSANMETLIARGVALINSNIVAVGTSSGMILLFEVHNKANNVSLKNDINDKHFQSGISALASQPENAILCASDTTRNVAVFSIKSIEHVKMISLIKQDYVVTCLQTFEKYVISGLGNGQITINDMFDGSRLIDIGAHGRWINSLDVRENLLISTGEDCFFRIWELAAMNDKLKVHHVQSERIIDNLISSALFNKGTKEICVSSYDSNQILIYKID